MMNIKFAIVDIDGTIADCSHREHYVKREGRKDWDSFYAESHKDSPINKTVELIKLLDSQGVVIIFVTGRSDKYKTMTRYWLDTNYGSSTYLYMRNKSDFRQDYKVKFDILKFLENKFNLSSENTIIFEDRDQVVSMYRENNYQVYQVNYGNF